MEDTRVLQLLKRCKNNQQMSVLAKRESISITIDHTNINISVSKQKTKKEDKFRGKSMIEIRNVVVFNRASFEYFNGPIKTPAKDSKFFPS